MREAMQAAWSPLILAIDAAQGSRRDHRHLLDRLPLGLDPLGSFEAHRAAESPDRRSEGPDPLEAGKLVQAALVQDADRGTIVWILLVTGSRRSEIAPPELQDIDFGRRRTFIESSEVEGASSWVGPGPGRIQEHLAAEEISVAESKAWEVPPLS
jgi:integrase